MDISSIVTEEKVDNVVTEGSGRNDGENLSYSCIFLVKQEVRSSAESRDKVGEKGLKKVGEIIV